MNDPINCVEEGDGSTIVGIQVMLLIPTNPNRERYPTRIIEKQNRKQPEYIVIPAVFIIFIIIEQQHKIVTMGTSLRKIIYSILFCSLYQNITAQTRSDIYLICNSSKNEISKECGEVILNMITIPYIIIRLLPFI